MARVRRALVIPLELSNRGKMFPAGSPPGPAAHGLHPLERAGVISRE